jgi:alpha-tubulin suppressor-like RCC1 family protein
MVSVMIAGVLVVAGMVLSPPPAAAEPSSATTSSWAWRSMDTSGPVGCAIRDDGSLRCWGANGSGQLGLGDTLTRGDGPGEMGAALPAVDLGPGRTAAQVSAGPFNVCAVLDNGQVKCWGANAAGQLGQGLSTAENVGDEPNEMGAALPPIDLGAGRTALEVAVSTGGAACALLDDHSVKCWGGNNLGQLGQGDTTTRGDGPGEMGDALPAVDLGPGHSALAVSVGGATVCAIREDHLLVCWGDGTAGKLGSGSFFTVRGDGPNEMGANLPVVDLGPGHTVAAVSVGAGHVCAVLDDHSVKCWGSNVNGELGLGDAGAHRGDGPGEMGANLPTIDLGPGRTAVGVTAGHGAPGNRHTCALLDDGEVKCWGYNAQGQLGLGDTATRGDEPGEMGADLPAVDLAGTAKSVAAGTLSTCALLGTGAIRCWGSNLFGNLGLGDSANRGDGPGEMGSALPVVKLGSTPAPVLEADYRFLRSRLSSVAGAPNLVDAGPGTNVWARERVAAPLRSVLRFPEGNGVDVPMGSSVVPDDLYTIAVLFRIDALDNPDLTGFERIVQWTDDASESGLYAHEGRMEFYPRQSDDVTGATVDVDEWVQVVVTRSRVGRLRVYLDGVPTLDFSDDAREGVVTADDVLRFFRDDTEEDASGAVARIRLWNRPLTPTAVAALRELPPGATVTRSRPSAAQQATVRVAGANFGPLEQVRLTIRDRRGVTRTLGIPRSNRAGAISRQVVIPGAMADGAARITATGLVSKLVRRVNIRIT